MNLNADLGGHHCPCPVLVSFLSGFRFQKIVFGVCLLSGFCPEFRKKAAHCLPVRSHKEESELSGLSLSLSTEVCQISQND